MNIYFTTINQSQKLMKYTGMNLSHYLLGLLTICKIFSNFSTRLPGPDFQTEVRSDFSSLFVHLLEGSYCSKKSTKLSSALRTLPWQLTSFFTWACTSILCAYMCACPKWIIQAVWKSCLRWFFHQILFELGIKTLQDPFTFTSLFYYLCYSFFRALSFTSQRLRSYTAISNVTRVFSRLSNMVSFSPTSICNLNFSCEGTGTA